ncbi:MAG: septum site-determining protein MinC [Pilosibacter sp.]
MELSSLTGQFYKGNLRDGDELESEASIVVIGDVERGQGQRKGNIVVLGALAGAAYAGVCGNEDAVIVAFEMAPMSVWIAGLFPEKSRERTSPGTGADDDPV